MWSWSYTPWQPEVWWKSFSLSGSVIAFSIVEITLLSSTKQNIQVRNILEKILYNKTVSAFNWKHFRVNWVNPRFCLWDSCWPFFVFFCIIVCLYLFLSFGHSVPLYCLSFFEWRLLKTILVFANYSVKSSLELMLYCFTMCRIKIKFSYSYSYPTPCTDLNNIISYKNASFNWARW